LEKETASKLSFKELHPDLYQNWRDCVDAGDIPGAVACLAIMQKHYDHVEEPAKGVTTRFLSGAICHKP
jgi:hypothetical protein